MIEVLAFIITLGILVTVHEYGHFWVARRCGVKVIRFSVGFGSPLVKWKDKLGTEYCIAAIPLGGYVKMLDEREAPVAEEELESAFNRKPVQQRTAVVVAGPLANLILAALVSWGIYLGGVTEVLPQVEEVKVGSVAEQAGLQPGHIITAVDGEAVSSRQDLLKALLKRLGESGEIELNAQILGSDTTYSGRARLSNWLKSEDEPNPIEGLGISLFYPKILPVLGEVSPGSPADKAGLQAGDEFISANDELFESWEQWVEFLRGRPGAEVAITFERDKQLNTIALTPETVTLEDGSTIGRIGVIPTLGSWPEHLVVERDLGFLGALHKAVVHTWDMSGFVLVSIKKLILGEISTKNLSGPISIAKVAGASAESGLVPFFGTLAMLSITLGILNLLPIPVLDGGHLLYYLLEWAKGSPLPEKVQIVGYQMGMFLLAGVMGLAIYNDILRL
ncbi:MAG: RIP metalloprotease RseP [Cellvibrionaceae bacterium]